MHIRRSRYEDEDDGIRVTLQRAGRKEDMNGLRHPAAIVFSCAAGALAGDLLLIYFALLNDRPSSYGEHESVLGLVVVSLLGAALGSACKIPRRSYSTTILIAAGFVGVLAGLLTAYSHIWLSAWLHLLPEIPKGAQKHLVIHIMGSMLAGAIASATYRWLVARDR